MFVKGEKTLVIGARYQLIKPMTGNIIGHFHDGARFVPPHIFIYKGVNGVGDHQDQDEFEDVDEGLRVVFCSAARTSDEQWYNYLAPVFLEPGV